MNEEIARLRTEFTKNGLSEKQVSAHPVAQFKTWFTDAVTSGVHEPNAMNLSTVGVTGRPTSRIVLLKDFDERGFTFYTNYTSTKGQNLLHFPYAALTFFWPDLERQIRIEGQVEKVSAQESDEYFAIRPRGSQLGAWVSDQSKHVASQEALTERVKSIEKQFEGQEVTRPSHWGGFRVIADSIEFWQGRPNRLHDRLLYTKQEGSEEWTLRRLYP